MRWLPILLVLIGLAIAVCVVGCASAAKKKAQREQEQRDAREHQEFATSNLAVIASEADHVNAGADGIIKALSESPPGVQAAKGRAAGIKGAAGKIMLGVKAEGAEVRKLNDDYHSVLDRAKDAEDDRDKSLFWWLTAFVVAGILIVVGGVFVSMLAPRIPGIPLLAAGGDLAVCGGMLAGLSLSLRLGIRAIGPYQWIPGLTAAVTIAVAIAWFGWKTMRRFRLNKAVAQLREGVRHAEERSPDSVDVKGLVAEKLDDSTKKLVGLPTATDPELRAGVAT